VFVLMIAVAMAVRVRMACAVSMIVFVFVKHDFQTPAEGISDPAQGLKARYVVATLKAGDHGLGHAKPGRKLLLRLSRACAKLKQMPGALRRNCQAVIERSALGKGSCVGCHPACTLADLLTMT
jgi:hypothetical protein